MDSSPYNLKKLKQLFGEPVLLGREKMSEFDEHANALLEALEPQDAVMAAAAWELIVTSYGRGRLTRFQSRSVQSQILENRQSAGRHEPRDREEEATISLQQKLDVYEKYEWLISNASRRETDLLKQICFYRQLLNQKLGQQLEYEREALDIEERKRSLLRQKHLDETIERIEREKKAAAAASQRSKDDE